MYKSIFDLHTLFFFLNENRIGKHSLILVLLYPNPYSTHSKLCEWKSRGMPTKGNLPLVFHLGQKCFVQMPPSLGTEMSVSQEGTGKKKGFDPRYK